MGLYHDFKDWASRQLQPGEPNTFVEGGGNTDTQRFQQRDRDRERLEKFEAAYEQGGPVAQLIDTRALMSFGTGSEFVTNDEERTVPVDGEDLTVAEWLEEEFPDRDNLFVRIGRDNYVYGDALGELVETRGGDFSHVELVNPKTMDPRWDDKGEVKRWIQRIDRGGMRGELTESFDDDDIAHIALHRIGRHPMGISLLERNWDEVQRFAQNQEAVAEALQMHAFVKWHVQAGREGQTLDDRELRRVRSRFNRIRNDQTYITGADVDIEALDTGGIGEGIDNIAENDLTMLAAGFGVPEEMAGLGRGSTEATAKVRLQAFERTARAEQRTLADQFIEQVVRPVLEEYSPFPRDVDVDLRFDDVVSDQEATANWLRDFKGIYTPDEMREKLGDGPIPEDVDEEDLGVPGDEGETPSARDGIFASEGGDEHPFRNRRALTTNAHADWEAAWHELIEHALWSDDPGRQLFGGFADEQIPEFVKQRLREVILSGGVLFSDFETVPDAARQAVQETMLDSLETRHGWSIDSIANNLQDTVDLTQTEAERIARSETQAIVASGREAGYQERLDMEEARFDWVGPDDNRNSDACPWIKAQIPDEGVSMDRLKELIQEGNDEFVKHEAREFSPHIQCRHQPVRVVD